MSSALFNGCSFVWGDELKDPMNTRFSKLFCDELSMKEINLSLRGGSNDRIYRTTLDYLQNNPKPDAVVIVWSGIDRFEYINVSEKDQHDDFYLQCSPTRVDQKEFRKIKHHLMGYMLNIMNDYKRSIDTINKMCSIQFICDTMQIPLLQYQFTHRHRELIEFLSKKRPVNDREITLQKYYNEKIEYLKPHSSMGLKDYDDLLGIAIELDDVEIGENWYGHPREKFQTFFANKLIDEFRIKHDCWLQ